MVRGLAASGTAPPGPIRKSAVRAAVEHVFARQKGPMALFIRTISRARTKIGLANLTYNMQRAVWLTTQTAPT